VMLTSKASPFDRLRGMMAGCDAYLSKPVSANDLHETLARYVGGPALSGKALLEMSSAA
jgi:two-component system, cell cycle response regulator